MGTDTIITSLSNGEILATPQSAILSAVIFNALIIVALVPLALRGVIYRPLGAEVVLRRNLLIYGLGGMIAPFIGIKIIDIMKTITRALVLLLMMTVITGIAYPLAVTGISRILFPRQANGSILYQDGKAVGSELIGQNFASSRYFHSRPSAAGQNGYDAASSSGSNLGPTNEEDNWACWVNPGSMY